MYGANTLNIGTFTGIIWMCQVLLSYGRYMKDPPVKIPDADHGINIGNLIEYKGYTAKDDESGLPQYEVIIPPDLPPNHVITQVGKSNQITTWGLSSLIKLH